MKIRICWASNTVIFDLDQMTSEKIQRNMRKIFDEARGRLEKIKKELNYDKLDTKFKIRIRWT